ncbi:MAG: hypothetical protein NC930_05265 [Candidatus Omnitrophica bacterium]|nr:hypothetical protein [Candidatus Omnitrophota bacterium]
MKNSVQPLSLTPRNLWKYALADHLEMRCSLSQDQQKPLLRALCRQRIRSESIEIHPAFSISGFVVVILDKPDRHQFWIYAPHRKTIVKI